MNALLSGRKPPAQTSAVKGVVTSLESAKGSALARQPSRKGIVGVLAGGLGVAAMAKRHRGGHPHDMTAKAAVAAGRTDRRRVQVLGRLTGAETQTPTGEGGIVQIPNEQVLEMRRQRGDHDRTQHVAQPLDRVNPAQHSGVLENVGIDPSERLGRTSGKLGR